MTGEMSQSEVTPEAYPGMYALQRALSNGPCRCTADDRDKKEAATAARGARDGD